MANMKLGAGITFAALAILVASSASGAPGRMDTTKRATQVATDQKAVLPDAKPIERNEVLMDKRFATDTVTKNEAAVGDRRSAIAITETRDKKTYATPARKEFDLIERKESPWAGKKSRYSTADDAYRTQTATRFQDKISDASPVTRNVNPAIDKRTTFDRINRFVFKKNSDQGVSVTTAGSEKPAADASAVSSPGAALPRR
jgi:hypothetical protein